MDIMGDLPYARINQLSPLELGVVSNFEEIHLWYKIIKETSYIIGNNLERIFVNETTM